MASTIDRCYQIAQYAEVRALSLQQSNKVTVKELRIIMSALGISNPKTQDKYLNYILENHQPLCAPQFKKIDDNTYESTPNRLKTPNELIAYAYEKKEREGRSE